jgi:hypothetical protein
MAEPENDLQRVWADATAPTAPTAPGDESPSCAHVLAGEREDRGLLMLALYHPQGRSGRTTVRLCSSCAAHAARFFVTLVSRGVGQGDG